MLNNSTIVGKNFLKNDLNIIKDDKKYFYF